MNALIEAYTDRSVSANEIVRICRLSNQKRRDRPAAVCVKL
ncbi:hypothetical protein [Microcoleus sp. FACHB-1515]|nr:hypothetical protein [Microcoleus sp. FACHB-1515]